MSLMTHAELDAYVTRRMSAGQSLDSAMEELQTMGLILSAAQGDSLRFAIVKHTETMHEPGSEQ